MNAFHFLRPAWLLALVPVLVFLVLLWRRRGRAAGWRSLVAPALLSHLLLDADRTVRRLPLLLLGMGWLLAVVALAGPTWERQPAAVYRAPADRVIVLDMSPSMATGDLQPDRLSRARFVIRDLLSTWREGRTALVVFGAEPHVVAPLTDDVATIEALLPALSVDILPVAGDRAGPALRLAGELLQRVASTGGRVLLLSDGIADTADSLDAARALRQAGVRVSVLGVGTPAGAPVPVAGGGFETGPDGGVQVARLDEAGLDALASAGGGRYLRLGAGRPETLLQQAVARDAGRAVAQARGVDRWVERGPWLLLPLLLIAAAGFRRGWLGLLLILVLPPPPAQAFGWQDLWLRPDQQASRLLAQGRADAAAEHFEDADWRGVARYRAGDYGAAAGEFSGDSPDSLYNRGNALARAGRLQEALAAYDSALERRPEHADARFNRDLVERMLRDQRAQAGRQAPSDRQDQAEGGQDAQAAGAGQPGVAGSAGESGQPQRSGAAPSTPQGQDGSATHTQPGPGDAGNTGVDRAGEEAGTAGSGLPDSAAGNPPAPATAGSREPAPAATNGATPQEQSGSAEAAQNRPGAAAETGTEHAAGEEPRLPGSHQTDPADAAARARADVAPSVRGTDAPGREDPAGTRGGAAPASDRRPHASEQDIAMEQWLRQIPDDPAGLLRRKFMLEHLLRQQGEHTP